MARAWSQSQRSGAKIAVPVALLHPAMGRVLKAQVSFSNPTLLSAVWVIRAQLSDDASLSRAPATRMRLARSGKAPYVAKALRSLANALTRWAILSGDTDGPPRPVLPKPESDSTKGVPQQLRGTEMSAPSIRTLREAICAASTQPTQGPFGLIACVRSRT